MDQIRLDPDEVLWWKAKLRAKTKLQTLELIGKTDPKLTAMARLVKMFVDTHKLRAVVAMGTNERSRFEYRPRRRIVLGSDSLIQALHELGHAKFGPSEALAVAWSTKMFMEITNGDIQRAKWHGHILTNEHELR